MFFRSLTFAAMFAGLAASASAADIKGKVSGSPGKASSDASAADVDAIVVWVEGIEDAKPPAEPLKVSQKGTQFSPRFSVAVVGQSVEMPNDDNIAHNVFSKSPTKPFNLGVYPKGESKTVDFDKPGRVDLLCKLHRQMTGIILVVPNTSFAILPADGAFKIPAPKPGKYTLKAWQKDCLEFSKEIVVGEGDLSVNVELKKGK